MKKLFSYFSNKIYVVGTQKTVDENMSWCVVGAEVTMDDLIEYQSSVIHENYKKNYPN